MLRQSVASNINYPILSMMAGTKKVLREVWIKISEHPSDGFYPALTLLPPQSYRTDPFEKISNELPDGTIEKLYDSEAKKELLAKIRPAGGGVDDTFFEEVQVRATLIQCNIQAHVCIIFS